MADEKPRGNPIYGTDVTRPLEELIEGARHQLVQVRGQLHDMQHHIGFRELLETAAQSITCTIVYLSYAKSEVEKAHKAWAANAAEPR